MAPMDEQAARRADWTPGVAVALADGQEWHFRRPRVKFRVAVDGDGRPFARRFAPEHGRDYLDIAEDLMRSPGDEDAFGKIVALTLPLLRLNYDVPDDYVPELYQYERDDADSIAAWERLYALAIGQSPDPPSPVG